jgi:hypothetical protein
MNLLVWCVMEGSMILCQKNILEHSLSFYGDYKKGMHTNNRGQSDIVIIML